MLGEARRRETSIRTSAEDVERREGEVDLVLGDDEAALIADGGDEG